MKRIEYAAAPVFFACAVFGSRIALAQAPQADAHSVIADTVFVDENGRAVRVSDYGGKVVLIDFWGKWCLPCLAEIPSLQQMQKDLTGSAGRIAYLFVSIKPGYFAQDTAWLKTSGLIGNNYRWEKRTPDQYRVFFNAANSKWWVPNSVVIDCSGVIEKWVRGSGTDWRVSADLMHNLAAAAPCSDKPPNRADLNPASR
jgi:thiol-disulfide isomerase/thioredoxin